MDREVRWQRESAERAERLIEALLFEPENAQAMLAVWEEETARRLNVVEYRQLAGGKTGE